MFSSLIKRSRVVGPLVVLAVVTALTVAGVPAVADPVAETAGVPKKMVKMVKRALGLSRKAHRRSTIALKQARNADGQTGPQGPAGPAGPRGLRGLKGEPGTNGSNGANGTNGVSVEKTADLDPGEGGCVEGGVEYTSASGTDVVCNGEDGEQGPAGSPGQDGEDATFDGGPLADGATLTGAWELGEQSLESAAISKYVSHISFAVPLAESLGSGNVHYVPAGPLDSEPAPPECDDENPDNGAPGVDNPEADPGHLCVFAGGEFTAGVTAGDNVDIWSLNGSTDAASPTGALLVVDNTTGGFYVGSFAVTGFEPSE